MITRDIVPLVESLVKTRPVVTIRGPRQSGKTTLVRSSFSDFAYVNLEDPGTYDLAISDYKTFMARYKPPLIIDEIQKAPRLTSAIQVAVDEHRGRCGQYILTGSHQPLLMRDVSQSLAGRTALVSMFPLSVAEATRTMPGITTDELIVRGFMPELYSSASDPIAYYKAYFETYVSRDVRQIVNIKEINAFRRFMVLLAGRVGQCVNLSSLCGETGVSSTTLAGWISILEASYIIFKVAPWFCNVSKRVVRTPKIYFTETGLAASLLGIKSVEHVASHPLRGNLFENMVMADIMKQNCNFGERHDFYMMRTADGFEIDALVQCAGAFRPIEIKSSMTYNKDFARSLLRLPHKEPKTEFIRPTVVYDGDTIAFSNGVEAVNFRDFKVDG